MCCKFDWVFAAPQWLTGPGIVALLVGISLGGLATVRAWVLPRLRVTIEEEATILVGLEAVFS